MQLEAKEASHRALAHQDSHDEHSKFDDCSLFAVQRNGCRTPSWGISAVCAFHMEVLQASVAKVEEQKLNGQHLVIQDLAIAVIFAFLLVMTFSYRKFRDNSSKILLNSSHIKKNFIIL